MTTELDAGIVRICKPDGSTVGTGFVVSDEGLVATCAHVVQLAGAGPGDTVRVVFHVTNDEQIASVEPECWRAPDAEDVAILRLEGSLPEKVKPLPFGYSAGAERHTFETFGFPEANPNQGLWGSGRILRETKLNDARVLQLESPVVTPGFSGAPVWDEERDLVVGMVSAITVPDRFGRLAVTAFATLSDVLVEVCPELDEWVIPSDSPASVLERKIIEYSCFISFPHGRRRHIVGIIDRLYEALSSELELLCHEEVYLDRDRLQDDYLYNEALAERICRSACMILVYTPTYFDKQHSYCAREYKAMEQLEEERLAALGLPTDREHSLIIPLVFRGKDHLPDEIKERCRCHDDFADFTLSEPEMWQHPRYAPKIREIAEYIADCCMRLSSLPQVEDDCRGFSLPAEDRVERWLSTVAAEPRFPRR